MSDWSQMVPLVAAAGLGAAVTWAFVSRMASHNRPAKRMWIPRRLILIRHGQSEANVDTSLYQTVPDNRVHLSEKGQEQALDIGEALKELIGSESSYFFVSPYVRSLETFHGVVAAFGGADHVDWREDPCLREQDFGNFAPSAEAGRVARDEMKKFGQFYYRFPHGESGADVYDRASDVIEALHRQWATRASPAENYVIVTHSKFIIFFLKRWFKHNVDEWRVYDKPENGEMIVLERDMNANVKKHPEGKLLWSHSMLPDGTRREERTVLPEHKQEPRREVIIPTRRKK